MSTEEQPYFNPHKSTRGRTALIVAGVSSLFCILLITLLFVIGKDSIKDKVRVKSADIIELLSTPKQKLDAVNIDSSEIGIELPQGGWVQQTDSMGKLKQQYRCQFLDPDPPLQSDGWIEMTKPEVELYLGNKIIVITGNTAAANAPKRILESGSIDGDVKVKVFDLSSPTGNQTPVMELHTTQVKFDNLIGEINCPDVVRIFSENQLLVGRKLSVRFNDVEEQIELVHIEKLDYILFTPSETVSASTAATTSTGTHSLPNNAYTTINLQEKPPETKNKSIDYFIVTISNNVTITQGDRETGRFASGDELTITFSNKSDTSDSQASKKRQSPMQRQLFLKSIPITIAATAIAYSQPTASQAPVKISCDGGLTMIPLNDPSLKPSTPEDTRIELFAFEDKPAELTDAAQNMTAYGSLLRFELLQDRSDLFGSPAGLHMNEMLTSADHLWMARAEGAGGAIGAGTMTSRIHDDTQTSLRWSQGVDFSFDKSIGENEGALNKVICNGDVVLEDQGNTILCKMLEVYFEPGLDGSTNPSLAIATGDVKATSEAQTMWANSVGVSFKNDPEESSANDSESMFGGSHADTMEAEGDVQILLSDGGRAFCNSLDGHISQDRATLTGNVVIAYQRMLMNRGEHATLSLDRATGKGNWEGPGQAVFLNTPLDVSSDSRIDRPDVQPKDNENNSTISMRSNWAESMHLDQAFNEAAGAIDLRGAVRVLSQPSPEERSQMTGDDLRLEFTLVDELRELKKIIAKTDAQIEHRTWDILFPDLPPVVYYIGGNHVEFDAITQETLAVGNGELVLRDPRETNYTMHQSALAGRGTTRFTWDNKLKTTKLVGNKYRLEMSGNVEMVHKGLDGSIGMLTSDKIEAIAMDPDIPTGIAGEGAEFTMRGLDLQQLFANGRVYVATETRRVDCDNFEYNLKTGLAKLSAEKNSTVAIVTEGTNYPVRASSILWNMDPAVDTITIRGLHGTNN